MAIKVYNNKITIGDYTLEEGPGGLVFNGIIGAEVFVREGTFQGKTAGFTAAGFAPGPSNVIDRFPFAADSNAIDHGDLTQGRYGCGGMASDTYGYTAGGASGPTAFNTIDKFLFVALSNATDVGDLSEVKYTCGGNSSKKLGYGFVSGSSYPTSTNIIDRTLFTTDVNSFDAGDLSQSRAWIAASSSETHAYNSGGEATNGGAALDTIDKFPMSATSYALATDVGNLTTARTRFVGQSSVTHGYASGGATYPPGTSGTTIDKFPFAADTNATSVGNLTAARWSGAGSSSQTHGYTNGGTVPPGFGASSVIDKFSFSNDANATTVGNLTIARGFGSAGTQI